MSASGIAPAIPHYSALITHRFPLVCNLHGPRFADHGDLDFARVVELLLDGAGDVAAGFHRLAVVECGGVGDDTQLSAGLDGVRMLDTGEALGQGLQL